MPRLQKQVFDGQVLYGIPIETVVQPYPLQGRTTLAKKAPAIAAQWYYAKNCGFSPDDFSFGSMVNAWWHCKKGKDHVWRQKINIRTACDTGCPFCASNKVSVTNSLACLAPAVAKQWHRTLNDCEPDEVTIRSTKAAFWQCSIKKTHVWQAMVADRTGPDRTGCPHCRADRTEGLKHYPGQLKYFDRKKNKGIDPFKLPVNSKVWWRCPKGKDHVWFSGFWKERANEHCPFCRGRLASSTNNLTLARALMKEYDVKRNKGIDPSKLTLGTKLKVWWHCNACGHSWRASVQTRTRRGYGCPTCARRNRRKK
jgi:hypothetical protein